MGGARYLRVPKKDGRDKKMEDYSRSDLACETLTGDLGALRGASYREERESGCRIERLHISEEECARKLGKRRVKPHG